LGHATFDLHDSTRESHTPVVTIDIRRVGVYEVGAVRDGSSASADVRMTDVANPLVLRICVYMHIYKNAVHQYVYVFMYVCMYVCMCGDVYIHTQGQK